MKATVLFISLLLVFTNCNKDHLFDCVKSTGDEILQYRSSAAFCNINMKDNVDVILYSDTDNFIQVFAGAHLINGIITEVENGTLYIRNENKCNWVRSFANKYIVKVGLRNPQKIQSYGSGSITCMDSIKTNEFFFDSWNASGSYQLLMNNHISHLVNNIGRADIQAKGYSGVVFSYINDVGILEASQLIVDYFYIRNSSTGSCTIHVEKEMSAEINYTGNIYYSGNPYRVDKQITGSGKLILQ